MVILYPNRSDAQPVICNPMMFPIWVETPNEVCHLVGIS